jgi:hypothetical protein
MFAFSKIIISSRIEFEHTVHLFSVPSFWLCWLNRPRAIWGVSILAISLNTWRKGHSGPLDPLALCLYVSFPPLLATTGLCTRRGGPKAFFQRNWKGFSCSSIVVPALARTLQCFCTCLLGDEKRRLRACHTASLAFHCARHEE